MKPTWIAILGQLPPKREGMHIECPAIFRRICICIEFEFASQETFHVCVCAFVAREIPEKVANYVYLIYIDGAQKFSRMCMCSTFPNQVLKQKNAHVFLPVGMAPPPFRIQMGPNLRVQKGSFGLCTRNFLVFVVWGSEDTRSGQGETLFHHGCIKDHRYHKIRSKRYIYICIYIYLQVLSWTPFLAI